MEELRRNHNKPDGIAVDSARAATGIAGLDNILNGGFPKTRLYLVEGDPGAGKTTLALQFLREGFRLGESGLYVSLSETKDELQSVAESHGWTLDGIAIHELALPEEKMAPGGHIRFFTLPRLSLGEPPSRCWRKLSASSRCGSSPTPSPKCACWRVIHLNIAGKF